MVICGVLIKTDAIPHQKLSLRESNAEQGLFKLSLTLDNNYCLNGLVLFNVQFLFKDSLLMFFLSSFSELTRLIKTYIFDSVPFVPFSLFLTSPRYSKSGQIKIPTHVLFKRFFLKQIFYTILHTILKFCKTKVIPSPSKMSQESLVV